MSKKKKNNVELQPNEQVTNFAKYRGQIDNLYKDEISLNQAMGRKNAAGGKATAKLKQDDLKSAISSPEKLVELSKILYATDSTYASILNYFRDMYYYRYKVTPTLLKSGEKSSKKDYGEMYSKMLSVVDGINIETIFPSIISHILVNGSVSLYADKNNKSETIETIILPQSYCKPAFKTQFNTSTVLFNFEYFKDIKSKLSKNSAGIEMDMDTILGLFPKEFAAKYKEYERDSQNKKWQELDPRYSVIIQSGDYGIPQYILANNGIIDYDQIKENEITRSSNELEKILVHKIPSYEGNLVFEVPEAQSIHKGLSNALRSVKGLKVLTVFGETELIELQESQNKENKARQQAYEGIYYDAAVNPNIFISDTPAGINLSITKDATYIWDLIKKITLFYNVAVNNLYNFKPYQAKIQLLPITIYNYNDQMESYRQNAEYGIGILDAIVASGIKQSEIQDVLELEEYLELNTKLKPLQSSHTTSSSDILKEQEQEKQDSDKKQVNDDKAAPEDEEKEENVKALIKE